VKQFALSFSSPGEERAQGVRLVVYTRGKRHQMQEVLRANLLRNKKEAGAF
jgi:hypothetical protein